MGSLLFLLNYLILDIMIWDIQVALQILNSVKLLNNMIFKVQKYKYLK